MSKARKNMRPKLRLRQPKNESKPGHKDADALSAGPHSGSSSCTVSACSFVLAVSCSTSRLVSGEMANWRATVPQKRVAEVLCLWDALSKQLVEQKNLREIKSKGH